MNKQSKVRSLAWTCQPKSLLKVVLANLLKLMIPMMLPFRLVKKKLKKNDYQRSNKLLNRLITKNFKMINRAKILIQILPIIQNRSSKFRKVRRYRRKKISTLVSCHSLRNPEKTITPTRLQKMIKR